MAINNQLIYVKDWYLFDVRMRDNTLKKYNYFTCYKMYYNFLNIYTKIKSTTATARLVFPHNLQLLHSLVSHYFHKRKKKPYKINHVNTKY